MLYIGIDLGTSSCKLLLVDEKGRVLNSVSREYPLYFPRPGWSEQEPEDWFAAVCGGIPELLRGFDASGLDGIGVAGQMHGLVCLDSRGQVVRPAILWNDGRTSAEVDYLNGTVGRQTLSQHTANIAFAGFTAPKLLWLKNNEPENFSRIEKIMLPKDYINYRLTGVHACEPSDASGTLLYDVERRCWSRPMLELCGVSEAQMPRLFESGEVIGSVLPELAERLGLPQGVKVVAGAGDNAAAAIGTGTVGRGKCNISLGTSGTIFISSDTFCRDPGNALHAFAHADGGWHLMSCMLSAASCNKWWMENILNSSDYQGEQRRIDAGRLGRNNVFFLPYLMGERNPINDTDARGTFIGLNMGNRREDMLLAVLEGVAFAIRDSLEIARAAGNSISRSTICGGGSRSRLWTRIIANVTKLSLEVPSTEQGPGYGAAILAMSGCGLGSVRELSGRFVRTSGVIEPEEELTGLYDERYARFSKIYPACRELFKALA